MDTRKLEALLTAVELGSFTRAAEVLGYTQSGLTHMMNSLEKDIGFTVLVRGRSGVQLTPADLRQPVPGDGLIGRHADAVLLVGVDEGDLPLQRRGGGQTVPHQRQQPLTGGRQLDAAAPQCHI